MEKENLGLPLALQAQMEEADRQYDAWLDMLGTTREEFREKIKKAAEDKGYGQRRAARKSAPTAERGVIHV